MVLKSKLQQEFTHEQILFIQKTLDETIEDGCVPKKIVFESIVEFNSDLFDMEQYQFERLFTKAIRSNKISGYEVKQGRGGGICKKGSFQKTQKKKRASLTFKGKTFKSKPSASQVLSFIVSSGKEGSDGKGNLFINNKLYTVPETLNTFELLEGILSKENDV